MRKFEVLVFDKRKKYMCVKIENSKTEVAS